VTENLPWAHPEFRQVTWFGLSSAARATGVFYVDNLRLERVGP
jgi:hypothetical protein